MQQHVNYFMVWWTTARPKTCVHAYDIHSTAAPKAKRECSQIPRDPTLHHTGEFGGCFLLTNVLATLLPPVGGQSKIATKKQMLSRLLLVGSDCSGRTTSPLGRSGRGSTRSGRIRTASTMQFEIGLLPFLGRSSADLSLNSPCHLFQLFLKTIPLSHLIGLSTLIPYHIGCSLRLNEHGTSIWVVTGG